MSDQFSIRNAVPGDLNSIIELDHASSLESKPVYWQGIFSNYVAVERKDRLLLVAESNGTVIGFIIGEVRAWEFGSPPCGWVIAIAVSPNAREISTGKRLFEELTARLKQAGVSTVRTMVDLDNKLLLSFFRSMGLRTGTYIELEKQLD